MIQYLYDSYGAGGGSHDYYAKNSADKPGSSGSVAFREDPQKLAYNGYQQSKKWYRSLIPMSRTLESEGGKER